MFFVYPSFFRNNSNQFPKEAVLENPCGFGDRQDVQRILEERQAQVVGGWLNGRFFNVFQ